MAKEPKPNSRLVEALLETADDMLRIGVMDKATHRKITLRHFGAKPSALAEPMTADDIRVLRETAQLSQAVFARCLNLTVGYVSQLERGVKRPTGAALALLNLIRRGGIEAVLQ
jgi:putative transcriptional regulator